ncbi:hypothetical protein ACWCPS_36180 [Streptomyces mauvecolor]
MSTGLPCLGNAHVYDALFHDEQPEQREHAQAKASTLCARCPCPCPCPDQVTPASAPRTAPELPEDWLPEHRTGRTLYTGDEPWHGTPTGVVTYGRPCPACTDAHTADRNRRNAVSLGRAMAKSRAYIPTKHRVAAFARMALDLHREGRTPRRHRPRAVRQRGRRPPPHRPRTAAPDRSRSMNTKPCHRRRTTTSNPAPAVHAPRPHLTLVDLRHPLPVRRPRFTGPATPAELTEARAALASAAASLPIPHLAWHAPGRGRAFAVLADGTVITHFANRAPVFTVQLPLCPCGAIHETTITTAAQLEAARTAACTSQHDDTAAHEALPVGIQAAPSPAIKTPAVRSLGEGLRRAAAAVADTQSLVLADIAATLEQAEEHPEP